MITIKIENIPDNGKYWQVFSNSRGGKTLLKDVKGNVIEFIDTSVTEISGILEPRDNLTFVLYDSSFSAVEIIGFAFADDPKTWEGFTFVADWVNRSIAVFEPGKVVKSDNKWLWILGIGVVAGLFFLGRKEHYSG